MRGTRSDDVILEGAIVPDKYISRTLPAGGVDAFVLATFAWALLGFGNIYYGVAQRACDIALPAVKKKTSLAVSRSMAYHPEVQHAVAQMILALDPVGPHLEQVAQDWSAASTMGPLGPPRSSPPNTMPSRRAGRSSTSPWRSPAAPACSSRANSSGFSATPAAAASIRPTPCWCMRSWPRRHSALISANSRDGDDRVFPSRDMIRSEGDPDSVMAGDLQRWLSDIGLGSHAERFAHGRNRLGRPARRLLRMAPTELTVDGAGQRSDDSPQPMIRRNMPLERELVDKDPDRNAARPSLIATSALWREVNRHFPIRRPGFSTNRPITDVVRASLNVCGRDVVVREVAPMLATFLRPRPAPAEEHVRLSVVSSLRW